jgi:hypothetical protein
MLYFFFISRENCYEKKWAKWDKMDHFIRKKHVYLLQYFSSGILTLFNYDRSKTVAEIIRHKLVLLI